MTWCLCVAIAVAACKQVKAPLKAVVRAMEPQTPATVITIQTTLQPQNKTFLHAIVIAKGRARSSDEVDRWRLFNLAESRVSYVDDVAKTYYSESIGGTSPPAAARAEDIPRPQLIVTGAKRVIQGIDAVQLIIRFGGYQRELWVGNPPSVPDKLYAMMHASDEGSKLRGFPLVDHAELAYGKSKLVVDRTVLNIEQRDIPESFLDIRADYKEIKAPGERRPPASSPPAGRSIPAAEWRSSGTAQTTP